LSIVARRPRAGVHAARAARDAVVVVVARRPLARALAASADATAAPTRVEMMRVDAAS
jgi:hypothetical protein